MEGQMCAPGGRGIKE